MDCRIRETGHARCRAGEFVVSTKKPATSTAIQAAAREFPEVQEGTACSQASFKVGGRAFLFIGMQGGRHKAMFKLEKSLAEAEALALSRPDDFQVGKNQWVTARFTDAKPLAARRWKKWLKESYQLSRK